jgi:cephalosporin hydroxylase
VSWRNIPGYSGFLNLYAEWVAQAKDGDVAVEVGVALGHSLAYLARLVIDSGKKIEVWGVDHWAGYARCGEQTEALGVDGTRGDFTLFLDQMRRHAPDELELVRVVRATSRRASLLFERSIFEKEYEEPADGFPSLVLIDGAHDHRSVERDIRAWRPLVRKGGWLCGDDHEPTYPGVEQACREAFGPDYEVLGTAWRKKL